MRVVFIVNEFAGNGKGKTVWQALAKQLTIPYDVYFSQYQRHSEQLTKNIAAQDEPCIIIVVGGDGSIHEVLNGLVGASHLIVGVVSAGSGNDFSRYYPTFTTAKDIEKFVEHQQSSLQDIGYLHYSSDARYFVNNSGIGFDAFVVDLANRSQLKRKLNRFSLGKLSYVYFVVQGLFQFEPFDLRVSIDGQQKQYTNVWFATISNQPYFGGGMKLSPLSSAEDGKLELTVVSELSRWKFLTVFSTVFFGKHTYFKEVEQYTGKRFELELTRSVPCHTDGEAFELGTGQSLLLAEAKASVWKLAKNMR